MNDIKEMMSAWGIIEQEAKKQFPDATKDELYDICKSAMYHALGLTDGYTENGRKVPIKNIGEGSHHIDIY